MAKTRICVLQSSVEGCTGALAECDSYRRPEVFDTAGEFEWTQAYLRKATSVSQLLELTSSGKYDVYMNLCDGCWDEDRAGRDVVDALERLNVPYTGADLGFYDPCKVQMKLCAGYYGVQVPPWVHIQACGGPGPASLEAGIAKVLAPPSRGGLRFPLIVKHPRSYSSVGMTRASKVSNEEQLREQVQLLVQRYGGALVEEFIPGREFTVLVVEEPRDTAEAEGEVDPDSPPFRPVAYTPVECMFGPGEDFKHFDLKRHDYSTLQWKPCDDPALSEKLKEAAINAFIATRGVAYGRCDFRVDPSGEGVYFLEINDNCGVLHPPDQFGSADFILSLDSAHDHMHFIRTIVNNAMQRHHLRQKKVAPMFIRSPAPLPAARATPQAVADPGPPAGEAPGSCRGSTTSADCSEAEGSNSVGSSGRGSSTSLVESGSLADSGAGAGGWGLVALVPIRAGEVVQRREHRPQVIASKSFVERCWPKGSRNRTWYDEYAWPISEEVWGTWSEDPAQWEPVNHSCDPNCWYRGLDVVARRDIQPGEQITIDYAMFCVEHMAPFDCQCGTAGCRGRITGTDHLESWVADKYGNHVSTFVAAKRRAAAAAAGQTAST